MTDHQRPDVVLWRGDRWQVVDELDAWWAAGSWHVRVLAQRAGQRAVFDVVEVDGSWQLATS